MDRLDLPQNNRCPRWWIAVAVVGAFGATTPIALAGGVSGYLPLNLEPEMARQIERVLILADEPILKRPFPVSLVQDALPQACKVDEALCTQVRRYLERYSRDYGVTHASGTGAITQGADGVVPNEHGLPIKSAWELSAQAYVQPNDYVLASGGAIAYAGRTVPTGSILSLGFTAAQLDIGYRDHWFSPLTDSSMLLSTEAPTLPSVTLSNTEPLTRLGFQYEFFLARMSRAPILYNGQESSGNPHLFGTQLSIEPFPGWSLGVNRLLQYGGGSGLPDSASFLLRDFFKPSGLSQLQGKQQASYVTRFLFPGKTPFAIYAQYAGVDNSDGGSYLLGDAALAAGIDVPRVWRHFDLTYEVSEWQDYWYVHYVFLNGLTQDGLVLGNWGADQRRFGDGVGARSQMLRLGWEPSFGGYVEARVRTLINQEYSVANGRTYSPTIAEFPYHHYVDFTLRYSHPWNGVTVGGEVFAGRDAFGQSFSRLAAFVRYGGDEHTRDDSIDEDSDGGGPNEHRAEVFVDAGMNANKVRINVEPTLPSTTTALGLGPHFALGARRAVSANNDLGVRLELDQINGHSLIGVRALDYRYRFTDAFALSVFAGGVRYALATPAISVYGGIGTQWRNILPKWDLGLDFRYAQNVARDHVLASDPQGVRPESFYKIESATLYLSRRF
jgi:hypothetical protein